MNIKNLVHIPQKTQRHNYEDKMIEVVYSVNYRKDRGNLQGSRSG